tara:strand:+ start:3099 stop:3611 length:513 start_codon:yes stop_codon:yes gene_type:complete
MNTDLAQLEREASNCGLLLRLQIRRPLNLWAFKIVVGQKLDIDKVKIMGEMKGWAYSDSKGLQLDTMRVSNSASAGVGHLIWAATMAWALESTPCKKARLLAIFDEKQLHDRLVKYFTRRGFRYVREVKSSLNDLPLRMVWGGSGSLMVANCADVLAYSSTLWKISESKY